MYATVLIASVKPGQQQAYVTATRKWLAERAPAIAGFVSNRVTLADDGRTIVAGAQFASADDYRHLDSAARTRGEP